MLCNAVSESFVVDVAAFKRIKGFTDKVKGSAYPIVGELFVRLHRQVRGVSVCRSSQLRCG